MRSHRNAEANQHPSADPNSHPLTRMRVRALALWSRPETSTPHGNAQLGVLPAADQHPQSDQHARANEHARAKGDEYPDANQPLPLMVQKPLGGLDKPLPLGRQQIHKRLQPARHTHANTNNYTHAGTH